LLYNTKKVRLRYCCIKFKVTSENQECKLQFAAFRAFWQTEVSTPARQLNVNTTLHYL